MELLATYLKAAQSAQYSINVVEDSGSEQVDDPITHCYVAVLWMSKPVPKSTHANPDSSTGPAKFIAPMLLKKGKEMPTGDAWLYEIKWDGFRCIAVKHGQSVHLWSRNLKDLTRWFPKIATSIQTLKHRSLIFDGEIVCLDDEGRPCFEDLANWDKNKSNLFFYAFDLLHSNGRDLRHLYPFLNVKRG